MALESLGAYGISRMLLDGYRERLDFGETADAIDEAAKAPLRTEAGRALAVASGCRDEGLLPPAAGRVPGVRAANPAVVRSRLAPVVILSEAKDLSIEAWADDQEIPRPSRASG